MNEIKFFGTDILKYYWYLIQNQFADSSWQITISYSIVLICIVAILVVTIGFLRRHKKRTKSQKMRKKLEKKYGEIVKDLLLDDSKTEIDVYEAFSGEDIKKHAKYFIDMIINIRNDLHTISYIPNIQHVCDVTGVTEYVEYNLLNNINVFETLNNVLMLQLRISEGRLANYVNSKNKDIRSFARIAYLICGTKEPYKYLYELLSENDSNYTYLLIHYTLMWLYVQNIKMPNFKTLIDQVNNSRSCAFIIGELPYFIKDKDELIEILLVYINGHNEREKIKSIVTSEKLGDEPRILSVLMTNYNKENTRVQKVILETILNIEYSNTSNIGQFFKDIYEDASDNNIKNLALRGLYKYNRDYFFIIHMDDTLPENDRILTSVIEAENTLKNMRDLLN